MRSRQLSYGGLRASYTTKPGVATPAVGWALAHHIEYPLSPACPWRERIIRSLLALGGMGGLKPTLRLNALQRGPVGVSAVGWALAHHIEYPLSPACPWRERIIRSLLALGDIGGLKPTLRLNALQRGPVGVSAVEWALAHHIEYPLSPACPWRERIIRSLLALGGMGGLKPTLRLNALQRGTVGVSEANSLGCSPWESRRQ